MRIGMSIASLAPMYWKRAGIGYYTEGLIQAIQNLSTDNTIEFYYTIRCDRIFRFLSNGKYKKNLEQQNLNYRLCPFFPLVRLPQQFSNTIDIYHATDYLHPRFKDNTAVISTLHDAFTHNNLQKFKSTPLRKLKDKILKNSIKHVDHIITVSNAMVADIVNYWGVQERNISVIYPGISDAWFQQGDDIQKKNVLNKYHLRQNFLLFVSTIQPRKNLERIIDAFKQLPLELQRRHQLIIVGQKGWGYETVFSKIKELEFNQVGKWLDYVPFDDLRILHQCASCVLCPSLGEGFGFPIVQGFASKTPVITSNISAMAEIAQDAALLVDPYSLDDIHQAILHILTDQLLYQDYVSKGWQRAHAFSWVHCAQQTLEVYKKIS